VNTNIYDTNYVESFSKPVVASRTYYETYNKIDNLLKSYFFTFFNKCKDEYLGYCTVCFIALM